MRILVLALVLASSSCSMKSTASDMAGGGSGGSGGGGSGGSGGSGGGGAPGDMTMGPMGDMVHPLSGISCGNQQCADSAQYCCTGDRGVSGTCNNDNDFNCASVFFYCDGPEDCPPGLAECCVVNGNSTCLSTGQCAGMNGTLMCHALADCEGQQGVACCASPKGPYSLCLATPCP